MRETEAPVETAGTSRTVDTAGIERQLMTWSMTAEVDAQKPSEFVPVLLAIAGHDLRQPLQVIQSSHELLGRGVRTKSELRLLRSGQRAIDRLKNQLDQILAALRLCEPWGVKLTPVQVGPLLREVCSENEIAALGKGIRLRVVSTSAVIQSDALLLSAILRNLVGNAIKYTQPGGHILLGCRNAGECVRIDVYDTGIGIAGDEIPGIFEAFTSHDTARRGSVGLGLFIVRQAVDILGHRLDVASAPSRGSRFSIFATAGMERKNRIKLGYPENQEHSHDIRALTRS
jgi:two-component system phosphate regulon sensor histidine kinase PhoR